MKSKKIMFRGCCDCMVIIGCMEKKEEKGKKKIITYDCPTIGNEATCDKVCPPPEAKTSHGFCVFCYQKALTKIKERAVRDEMQRM